MSYSFALFHSFSNVFEVLDIVITLDMHKRKTAVVDYDSHTHTHTHTHLISSIQLKVREVIFLCQCRFQWAEELDLLPARQDVDVIGTEHTQCVS